MNKMEFVAIKRFDNEPEAEMAEALLQSHDINTLLIREDPARMGIERRAVLKVRKEDMAKAKELLGIE